MDDPVTLGFRGKALRMAPGDMATLAAPGGFEVAALQAIMDVEAGSAGFEAGRPKILTEPHVFYAQLGAGPKRDAAVRAGLAYLRQGTQPYPANQQLNYQRLAQWCAIDATAALRSCSWGLGQIMGFNHAACGYVDVRDMVARAMESEIAQFNLMLRYLLYAGLTEAIQQHDWARVARVYNGPGAVDGYSARLAAAYAIRAKARLGVLAKPASSITASIHAAAARQVKPAAAPALTTSDLNDASWLRIRAGMA